MKKFLCIAALLTLLSGCVTINPKYTGRSRMRIYNDWRSPRTVFYAAPLSMYVMPYWWYWSPYYYGVSYVKSNKVYKRQLQKSEARYVGKTRSKAPQSTVSKGSSSVPKTSKGTGTRVKKK